MPPNSGCALCVGVNALCPVLSSYIGIHPNLGLAFAFTLGIHLKATTRLINNLHIKNVLLLLWRLLTSLVTPNSGLKVNAKVEFKELNTQHTKPQAHPEFAAVSTIKSGEKNGLKRFFFA